MKSHRSARWMRNRLHRVLIVSSVVEDITPFLPGDAVAYLRIADGNSRFPFRPVSNGMFLIGQGPSCDLRLGIQGVPSIHSVIQLNAESAEITRVADLPELIINGEATERSPLHHGDVIEIADVRLAFHRCSQSEVAASAVPTDVAKFLEPRELVAHLESEVSLVATSDSGREQIQDLLRAAQTAVGNGQFVETLRFADYAAENRTLQNSADQATQQLILAKLKSQELRLNEVCHVLEQIVQQQQLIATSLQSLAVRLDDLRTVSPTGTLRASA